MTKMTELREAVDAMSDAIDGDLSRVREIRERMEAEEHAEREDPGKAAPETTQDVSDLNHYRWYLIEREQVKRNEARPFVEQFQEGKLTVGELAEALVDIELEGEL